ncbi:MAG: hypothetical protein V3W41_01985 [Planctomycetota bacterium]
MGLDFLEDDGGLDAIRRTVIARFEAETLRAVMEAKIDTAEFPETVKKKLLGRLKSLAGKAFNEVAWKLLMKALENPNA